MALSIRKRGRYWYARGTIPQRQADGTIARVRIEESTRESSKTRASRVAADIAQHYHEQAYRPKPKSISFTDAAITYVETKNPSKRDRQFVAKLIAHFGETPIDEIDQAAVSAAAHRLYPTGSPSTHSRAVFAPTITILRITGRRTDFQWPRIDRKAISIPPEEWFGAVLPHCPPRLAGLLVFLTLTGRRITEAVEAIDNDDGTVLIPKTKSGKPALVEIPNLVRELLSIHDGRAVRRSKRLFGYANRHNAKRALAEACRRAGVPYYGFHALGRHSFASRLLRAGYSTKLVAGAGGWSSTRMVDSIYGHLARDEVQEPVRIVGQEWGRRLEIARKMAETKE